MARFYLSFTTMKLITQSKEQSDLLELLSVLSSAEEFSCKYQRGTIIRILMTLVQAFCSEFLRLTLIQNRANLMMDLMPWFERR